MTIILATSFQIALSSDSPSSSSGNAAGFARRLRGMVTEARDISGSVGTDTNQDVAQPRRAGSPVPNTLTAQINAAATREEAQILQNQLYAQIHAARESAHAELRKRRREESDPELSELPIVRPANIYGCDNRPCGCNCGYGCGGELDQ